MEREDLIKEWLEGRLSSDELDKRIQGDKALSDIKNIITRSAGLNTPEKRTKEEAWALLSSKIEQSKPEKTIRFNPYISLSIAATVTLVAFVLYSTFLKPERILAPKGQHISHILPDDSEVWLNADSELTYRSFGRKDERTVQLKGEAFFNIKNGGHFEVVCEYGTVAVLGTSFNIKQRDRSIEVACFTGTVKVTNNEGVPVTLKAGEFTRVTDQTLASPAAFNTEKEASWRAGDFYFEGVPLESVLSELERQFNIQVQYESTTPRSYTGYFNNKDLNEALQLVFQPMSLDYTKDGNQIIVK